jgi:pimeloyl-ACP methyl ester carboxylesterase
MAADDVSLDIELDSGRRLRLIVDAGAEPGSALAIYHHGTPAAGPLPDDLVVLARREGLQLVEVVRPGYPGTTRVPGRIVADLAKLALVAADALGHERFVTVGWSGGGPHALATAALSNGRCRGALSIAGVAPYGEPDLDFLAGMGQDNIEEFGAALQGEADLRAYLDPMREALKDATPDTIAESMASLLPPSDVTFLDADRAAWFTASLQSSLDHSVDGLLDDDLAFCHPWGFDLHAIDVPVIVLQGSEDLMVPFAHGEWLSTRVPSAVSVLVEGEGHMSILDSHGTQVFAELAATLKK